MARLAATTFRMGSDQGEPDETPAHEVTLKGFLLDRTEVTNDDYRACVDANACGAAASFTAPGLGGGKQPVVGVSWFDADRYCKWVGKRLPTEAEFERAVRGGDGRYYPWPGKYDPSRGNMRGAVDGHEKTAPVGSFPSGVSQEAPVLDLVGNAAEWVSDWYDPAYYTRPEAAQDPQGPDGLSGEKSVRGGSYLDPEYAGRGSARSRMEANQNSNAIGFRCAVDG